MPKETKETEKEAEALEQVEVAPQIENLAEKMNPEEEALLSGEIAAAQQPEGAMPKKNKEDMLEAPESHIYKQVKSITFSILSPQLVKDMASAKIVTPELYDKEGYPVDGGLMDIRLGVIDPGLRCKTCGS